MTNGAKVKEDEMPKGRNALQGCVEAHRDILDQLHEGVHLVDLDRNILYWNAGAEHISDYPSEKVVGAS